MSANPIHPATVHFPIAFIALTGFLDILYVASTSPLTASTVTSLTKTLDIQLPLALLPLLSYYTTIMALVTMVPAVLSGGPQMIPLIQRDGFKTAKARTALAHAALNDSVAISLAYNWWTRRTAAGFVPSSVNLTLSGVLAMPIVFFAASLGGDLVYSYGMGVGKSNRAKKSQ